MGKMSSVKVYVIFENNKMLSSKTSTLYHLKPRKYMYDEIREYPLFPFVYT